MHREEKGQQNANLYTRPLSGTASSRYFLIELQNARFK